MSLPGSAFPISVTLADAARFEAAGLVLGQRVRGVVVATPRGLAVQVSGARVPLPAGAALEAGQAVEVVLVETAGGRQFQITPRVAVPAGPAAAARDVLASLQALLESLGTLSASEVASAVRVVPTGTPLSEEAVRALLRLFTSRGTMGRDLTAVAAQVSRAAAAGILTLEVAEEVGSLLESLMMSEDQSFEEVVGRLGRTAGKPLEARLAEWLSSGGGTGLVDSLRGDVQARLVWLRQHEGLAKWLAEGGQLEGFREAVDGVLERLLGTHLQNARGTGRDYVFFEVPVPPGGAVESAQLHFFEEGGPSGEASPEDSALVVLDLRTAALGDLWVSLRVARGGCECHFRATSGETVEAIRGASEELAEGLKRAGYAPVRVRASGWDGDRLGGVAELMRRFSGIDVTA